MFRVSSILLSMCFSCFVAMLPMMTCFSFGMFRTKSKGALWTGEMLQKANFLKILKNNVCLASVRVAFVSKQNDFLWGFSSMFMGFATGQPNVLAKL